MKFNIFEFLVLWILTVISIRNIFTVSLLSYNYTHWLPSFRIWIKFWNKFWAFVLRCFPQYFNETFRLWSLEFIRQFINTPFKIPINLFVYFIKQDLNRITVTSWKLFFFCLFSLSINITESVSPVLICIANYLVI